MSTPSNNARDESCTCKWSPVVGRLLCPVCIERHLARNRDRKADY